MDMVLKKPKTVKRDHCLLLKRLYYTFEYYGNYR